MTAEPTSGPLQEFPADPRNRPTIRARTREPSTDPPTRSPGPRRAAAATTQFLSRSTVEDTCAAAHVDTDSINNDYASLDTNGAPCLAVTMDLRRLVPFLLALGEAVANDPARHRFPCPTEPATDLADVVRADDLGHHATVYFPGWALSPDPHFPQEFFSRYPEHECCEAGETGPSVKSDTAVVRAGARVRRDEGVRR